MAWYNYTRRDGTTYAGILLSRNGTKSGLYMISASDVTPGVRSVVRDFWNDKWNCEKLLRSWNSISFRLRNSKRFTKQRLFFRKWKREIGAPPFL